MLGIIAGIIVWRWAPHAAVILCVAAFSGAVMWFLRRYFGATMLIFVAVGGLLTAIRQPESVPEPLTLHSADYCGEVRRIKSTVSGTSVIVDKVCLADSGRWLPMHAGALMLNIYDGYSPGLYPGDRIMFSTRLHDARDLNMPGLSGDADYAEGITARGAVRSEEITVIDNVAGPVQRVATKARSTFLHGMAESGISDRATAFLAATVVGDTSLLDDTTRGYYRTAGIAHILAISGMHVGIIVAFILLLLRPLRLLRHGRSLYYALSMAAVALYAMTAGLTPSVTRASVMIAIYLVVKWLQQRAYGWNTLCATVAILLFINPLWLFSVGMQLSVTAVVGILAVTRPLTDLFTVKSAMLRYAIAGIAVTVGATLGTWPLTVAYFHSFPLCFLPMNLVAGVLSPIIIILGAVTAVLAVFGLPVSALAWCTSRVYDLLADAAQAFAATDIAAVQGLYPDGWQIVAAFAALSLISASLNLRSRRMAVAAMLTLGISVIPFALPAGTGDDGHVITDLSPGTVIMVYHGDSAMLVSGLQTSMIDDDRKWLSKRAAEICAGTRSLSHIRNIDVAGDTFVLGCHSRNGNILRTESEVYYIASDNPPAPVKPAGHIGRLVIERGFKGDPMRLINILNPDTVILSKGLHPVRRQRYERWLSANGVSH